MNCGRARSLGLVLALLSTVTAHAAERAGEATRSQQNAFQWASIAPGQLDTGDEIFRNAEVYTKDHGSVEMRMDDASVLTLGPNSEVVIDEFVYDPGDSAGQAALSLGKGVLRMVSGRIAPGGVRITTQVANIGIRGTDFILDSRRAGELGIWLTEGALAVSPVGTNQTFELVAPTFALCTTSTCTETTGPSPATPTFFPFAPANPGGGPSDNVNGQGGDDGGGDDNGGQD